MSLTGTIAPLKIADEGFLVAATIERGPRQMMLRELVMNAVESAGAATDAPPCVRIVAVDVDGTPKLSIWNTGPGLSDAELLRISDLSSSLFKTVGLDGNFGMGAKVASLTSNKLGLRYRSCKNGTVAQIVLGQRAGVYGRLVQRDATGQSAEVLDVTALVAAEGTHSLAHDWTEVLLMGNVPQQNTVLDPYAGDPAVPSDWVERTLGNRFLRIDPAVPVLIAPEVAGKAAAVAFQPEFGTDIFDRIETVPLAGGICLHYAYRAPNSAQRAPRYETVGIGMVAHRHEVYALSAPRRWALDAPTYGFTFAARNCTVLVELSDTCPVHPDQYRQFLRFSDGDQRQVQVSDFGDLIRQNIPAWLKAIIASMMPDTGDDVAEITLELQQLLLQLGIVDDIPPAPKAPAKPTQPADKPDTAMEPPVRGHPPAPPKPRLPTPPQIILVQDDANIIDRGLAGRVARFYPAQRQLFVNTRYAAFARLSAQLTEEFADRVDRATAESQSKRVAEWSILRRLARTLAYGFGKSKLGWGPDEVKLVQSAEAMSLLVDDIEALMPGARARMSVQLGLEPAHWPEHRSATEAAVNHVGITAERAASDLADAEARLQRAMGAGVMHLGPYYRGVATILVRQRNFVRAQQFLNDGIAADPADPWCYLDLAGLHMAAGDLAAATYAAGEALGRGRANPVPFLMRLAEIQVQRGDYDAAAAHYEQAATERPGDSWILFSLSTAHLHQGRFDAARTAALAAMTTSPVVNLAHHRRLSDIERRRGNMDVARQYLTDAHTIAPWDTATVLASAGLHQATGDLTAAHQELHRFLAEHPAAPPPILLKLSEIELQRGRPAEALAAANRACLLDPADPSAHGQRAIVFLSVNDLDGAMDANEAAIALSSPPGLPLLRRKAAILSRSRQYTAARAVLEGCLAQTGTDAQIWLDISTLELTLGNLQAAEAAVVTGQRHAKGYLVPFLRRRADLAIRQNAPAAALDWLIQTHQADPTDPFSQLDIAERLLQDGQPDQAATWVAQALAMGKGRSSAMILRRAASFERRAGHVDQATALLQTATGLYPDDSQVWNDLSIHYAHIGDIESARVAAETALQRGLAARTKLQSVMEQALQQVA